MQKGEKLRKLECRKEAEKAEKLRKLECRKEAEKAEKLRKLECRNEAEKAEEAVHGQHATHKPCKNQGTSGRLLHVENEMRRRHNRVVELRTCNCVYS